MVRTAEHIGVAVDDERRLDPDVGLEPDEAPGTLCLVPLDDPETGTRILRGLETGADEVFLTSDGDAVEADRLVPMVMAADVGRTYEPGLLRWGGTYLVNPWDGAGRLVPLRHYPRLRSYLERAGLAGRGDSRTWYRTAEPIRDDLVGRAKLIIDDRSGVLEPVLDPAGHYPHRDLQFVISDSWELDVLGGLLIADPYRCCRGLDDLLVPHPMEFTNSLRRKLRIAFATGDPEAATAAVRKAFGEQLESRYLTTEGF